MFIYCGVFTVSVFVVISESVFVVGYLRLVNTTRVSQRTARLPLSSTTSLGRLATRARFRRDGLDTS